MPAQSKDPLFWFFGLILVGLALGSSKCSPESMLARINRSVQEASQSDSGLTGRQTFVLRLRSGYERLNLNDDVGAALLGKNQDTLYWLTRAATDSGLAGQLLDASLRPGHDFDLDTLGKLGFVAVTVRGPDGMWTFPLESGNRISHLGKQRRDALTDHVFERSTPRFVMRFRERGRFDISDQSYRVDSGSYVLKKEIVTTQLDGVGGLSVKFRLRSNSLILLDSRDKLTSDRFFRTK